MPRLDKTLKGKRKKKKGLKAMMQTELDGE
jgi:hypothetical protein